jgi:hypothetical protein
MDQPLPILHAAGMLQALAVANAQPREHYTPVMIRARRDLMRHWKLLGVTMLALTLSIACGKSEQEKATEKAAEETKEAAEALAKAAEKTGTAAANEGMKEAAKVLEGLAGALGGATPDGKTVEPVSFQSLQSALPDVSGWERGKPTGERMTLPVPFSQAEVSYTRGESEIDIKIVDSAFSQLLIAPWSMFLTVGYEKQTTDGYEKSINIGGHPGFERWEGDSKDGELNLVVAKRFLVTVEGNNIADTKVLQEFASKIDAAKLASLK